MEGRSVADVAEQDPQCGAEGTAEGSKQLAGPVLGLGV